MKPSFVVRAVSTLRVSIPLVKMSVTVEDLSKGESYCLEAWADVTDAEAVGTVGLDLDNAAELDVFWFIQRDATLMEWAVGAARAADQGLKNTAPSARVRALAC